MERIPLTKPYITEEVKQKVCEVLDSGFLTEGAVTAELETASAAFLKVEHVIAVSNCTVGLETALRCLGIGPGDEVIVPDYTYPATAMAVMLTGAKAVLVDVEPETMLLDFASAEAAASPRTRAILPVSLFGNPLNYDCLGRLKTRYGWCIIEDAACAIGASFRGVMVGRQADLAVFSLHPRKFITTGEGGLITTKEKGWADWLTSYKHFGIGAGTTREGTQFRTLGTNYKLSNLQAAVGVVQMRHVECLLARRRELAARYRELLTGVPGVRLPRVTEGGCHSYQSFCVFVTERDHVLARMRGEGIEVQIGTYALHRQSAFQGDPRCEVRGEVKGSESAFRECLALPLFHEMTSAQQERVVERLARLVNGNGV